MNSESFLLVLLELLIKGLAILLAATLLDRAIRHTSAASRHFIWGASFVALALLPLTKLTTPRWQLELPQTPAPRAVSVAPSTVITTSLGAPISAKSPTTTRNPQFRIPDKGKIIIGIWIIGAVALIAHRTLGSLRLWQMKRQSSLIRDERLLTFARDAATIYGVARPVELRATAETSIPITWGCWRHVLMLPSGIANWDDGQVIAALRHEFGHIIRNDYLTRLFSYLVLALHWVNPLVWLAARRLRLLQEQACDDLVLRAGTTANDYATLLTEAARTAISRNWSGQHAVAMARPSTLEHRVVAILDDDRNRGPAGRLTLIAATTLLAITLTASTLAQVLEPKSQPSASIPGLSLPGQSPRGSVTYVSRKAKNIKIPRIDFRDASLRDCLNSLDKMSRVFDSEKEGLHFIIPLDSIPPSSQTITVSARDVSVLEAAKYVTAPLGLKPRVGSYGIEIVPLDAADPLYNIEYKVPPDFCPGLAVAPDRALSHYVRHDAAGFLKSKGLTFSSEASAVYVSPTRRLIMRNTLDNQELLQDLIADYGEKHPGAGIPVENVPEQPVFKKLAEITFPRLEFRETPVAEALKLLESKSRELDADKAGVKITVGVPGELLQSRITISLANIPLNEALKYVTNLAGLRFFVSQERGVVIAPPHDPSVLILKEYRVPETLSAEAQVSGPDGSTYADITALLKASGVTFPDGAAAALMDGGKILRMRNNQENLDLTDVIVAALQDAKERPLSAEELKLFNESLSRGH